MQKGINTDVVSNGVNFHVQTEDWGLAKAYLVTRIYRNGAVVKTYKKSYQNILQKSFQSYEETIRLAMKDQHYEILDLIYSGHLDNE